VTGVPRRRRRTSTRSAVVLAQAPLEKQPNGHTTATEHAAIMAALKTRIGNGAAA
jgi:hypothetical protein